MRTSTPIIVLLCILALAACDSDVPEETTSGGDTLTNGGDGAEADVTEDQGEDVPTPPIVQVPTALSFAAGGGTFQSENYNLHFVLAAPLQGGNAASESYQMLPIINTPNDSPMTDE